MLFFFPNQSCHGAPKSYPLAADLCSHGIGGGVTPDQDPRFPNYDLKDIFSM